MLQRVSTFGAPLYRAQHVQPSTFTIVPWQEEAQRAGERLGFYSSHQATGWRGAGNRRGNRANNVETKKAQMGFAWRVHFVRAAARLGQELN
jgi:hypothetical protein